MKQITNYISEKLKINKNIKSLFIQFCEQCALNEKDPVTKELYDLYRANCNDVIGDKITDDQRVSSDSDLIFMTAALLLDDNKPAGQITRIGFKNYTGNNNPYDFSWFEEENEENQTVLQVMQKLYQTNDKFHDMFDNIYAKLEIVTKDTKQLIDGIWEVWQLFDK